MKRTYEPGRTRWTTTTGWLMPTSALGAVVCSLAGVSPYPPLAVELALAGASAAFAVCWAAASHPAGRRPPKVSLAKAPAAPAPPVDRPRRPGPGPRPDLAGPARVTRAGPPAASQNVSTPRATRPCRASSTAFAKSSTG